MFHPYSKPQQSDSISLKHSIKLFSPPAIIGFYTVPIITAVGKQCYELKIMTTTSVLPHCRTGGLTKAIIIIGIVI